MITEPLFKEILSPGDFWEMCRQQFLKQNAVGQRRNTTDFMLGDFRGEYGSVTVGIWNFSAFKVQIEDRLIIVYDDARYEKTYKWFNRIPTEMWQIKLKLMF